MMPSAAQSFTALLATLTLRFAVLISLQAKARLGSKRFRWPEDAAHWRGTLAGAGAEASVIERVQAALRNDGESLPLFLIACAVWVQLGAADLAALAVCAVYGVTRSLHALFMVRPRQPLRNWAFAASQLCLVCVVIDAVRLAF